MIDTKDVAKGEFKMKEKLKSDNAQEIELEVIGKTIEGISIGDKSVVIKFTDGNFVDIDLDKNKQELITRLNMF
jgi:hypothetical protein